jgi:hypothetical protein
MRRFTLNLRLFDEGGATAGAAAGAEGASVTAGDAAGAQGENSVAASQERPSFVDLIKGDYKQEADKYIQGIVRERVKNSKDMIAAQGDILNIVAAKYGMDTSDLAALKERVSNDDAYYEDRAMEEGLTVDQYKRIAQAETKAREYEAQIQQQQRDQAAQQQIAKWQAEADQVKQVFPSFDLQAEIANPTFAKLLQNGVEMRSAYVAAHDAEIMQGAMQYTAAEVRKATANDIAARGTRPRENASSSQASASLHTDVSKLTRADREALSRRAAAGEIVTLT